VPCITSQFLDQLVDVIAALAVALGAFDAEHVELALDMASPQICRANATRIPAPKKQPKSAVHPKVSQESAELDESDRELLAVYQDHVDGDADIERARDAFLGEI
jgi:hypothetical protein